MPEVPDTDEETAQRERMAAVREAFRTAMREQEATRLEASRIPRCLYHYTNLDGLLGITATNALWASDVRFMNDSSELTYAADLITDVIDEVFAGVTVDALKARLPTGRGFANPFEHGSTRPYVACFCEQGDLLSQWRGYDTGQARYSLGMAVYRQFATAAQPPGTFLRKVIYAPDEQRQLVRPVVETWLSTAAALVGRSGDFALDDVFPYPAIWELQQALVEHHLCFKHPAFAEEQEWRLIKLVNVDDEFRLRDHQRREDALRRDRNVFRTFGFNPPSLAAPRMSSAEGLDIKFRPTAIGLVPYVELSLRQSAGIWTERAPLTTVIQGPSATPELSLEALATYLESLGFGSPHTEIVASGIPLRP